MRYLRPSNFEPPVSTQDLREWRPMDACDAVVGAEIERAQNMPSRLHSMR